MITKQYNEKPEYNSGIVIGYDFEKGQIISKEKEQIINESEKVILKKIIEILSVDFNKNDFSIIAKSDNYLTLEYKKNDIARIKFTNRAKWISILVSNEDTNAYKNNSLFDLQKNKNQLHWKSKLENDNIDVYMPLLKNSCKQTEYFINKAN